MKPTASIANTIARKPVSLMDGLFNLYLIAVAIYITYTQVLTLYSTEK